MSVLHDLHPETTQQTENQTQLPFVTTKHDEAPDVSIEMNSITGLQQARTDAKFKSGIV